jgi:tryptophanyl-tRNA synthetase
VEKTKRVLSGMRPTGRLHIGHYFGALENWVKLQNDPQYECFFFVADWHALTSDYENTLEIAQNSIEIAIDWLASGLQPGKCTMFIQSSVPEHAELNLLLSMITPLNRLEDEPTYKEALKNVTDKDLHTYGFLGYPVLQTADIVMYGEEGTELSVPVGEDQVPHIELSRDIVRKFHSYYSFRILPELYERKNQASLDAFVTIVDSILNTKEPFPKGDEGPAAFPNAYNILVHKVAYEMGHANFLSRLGNLARFCEFKPLLIEPTVMLTETPRIPGTDGRKMSKSYGNFISLNESDDSIRTKSRVMITDPARKRRTDPGNPDICPVYDWHKLFSPPETLAWSAAGCRSAGIGCIECKMAMADNLIKWIEPIRARREEYAAHPDKVLRILDDGSVKAREVAQKTMARVREAVFNWKEKRVEVAAPREAGKS